MKMRNFLRTWHGLTDVRLTSPECGRLCRPEGQLPLLNRPCGKEQYVDPVQLLFLRENKVVAKPFHAIWWNGHCQLFFQWKTEELCDVSLNLLQQSSIQFMVH